MVKPLLTIITVSYNSEATIKETLDSVKSQINQNFEYIIVDGKSEDSTLKIVNKYDCVDLIISEKDKGIYDGMNKGILNANGDFIGFLNSDDLFASMHVTENIINAIKDNDTNLIYGDISYFKNDVRKVTRSWVSGQYIKGSFNSGWHPPHPAFYASRDLFLSSGSFNLDLKISADFELMLRFFNISQKKPVYIKDNFVLMREGGASHINRKQGRADVLKAFELNDISIHKYLYLMQRYIPKFINRFIKYPFTNLFTLKK